MNFRCISFEELTSAVVIVSELGFETVVLGGGADVVEGRGECLVLQKIRYNLCMC